MRFSIIHSNKMRCNRDRSRLTDVKCVCVPVYQKNAVNTQKYKKSVNIKQSYSHAHVAERIALITDANGQCLESFNAKGKAINKTA